MDRQAHWDRVYAEKRPEQVSWFQAEARLSLELITGHAPSRASAIADIGGGASRLVDGLLARGYRAVTVLDLSAAALDAARARLAASGTPGASGATTAVEAPGATAAAGRARWIADDVLTHGFDAASIDVWHDCAVFHFLTDPADRARYVEQVRHAVRPGGLVLGVGQSGPPMGRHDDQVDLMGSSVIDDLVKVHPDAHLGVETGDLGKMLGLSNDFIYRVIKKVGNYGEVFERNLSQYGLTRGQIATWEDGGLLYSPPFR